MDKKGLIPRKINGKWVWAKDPNYTEEDKSYDNGPQTGQD